jgi:LPXTG-site transpeptidase (sortase) family protein
MLDFFRAVPKKRKVKINGRFGVIFRNPTKNQRTIFYLANLVLGISLGYLVYLYYPLFGAIYRYKTIRPETKTEVMDTQLQNTDKYMIQIPKILAISEVVAGVSPYDQAEYKKVLKTDVVAQAKGSFPPGSGAGKTTYIFAHSTRQGLDMVAKNAVFYLLGELQAGDKIFISYGGKDFTYRVMRKMIVSTKEISYLNYSDPTREVLILQTCWPIGTDWQRLIVLAELFN